MALNSWGLRPNAPAAQEIVRRDRQAELPQVEGTLLPFGNGRSYGDSCLNSGGTLLLTRGCDRFIDFAPIDETRARLVCDAGVLLAEIIELFLPRGWFLPVTPGTRFVTVGGAIANDVHGKNHHRAGSFGNHVRRFELLRSDGSRRICSATENANWFAATVGGLGLTGLITWAEIELRRVGSDALDVSNTRFEGLDEFWAINAAAEAQHEYAVAWIDCLARRPRGIFMAGDHVGGDGTAEPAASQARRALKAPFTPPFSPLNALTLRAFNTAYYHRPLPARARSPLLPYFYPLDGILEWNRLYGRRGFYQYQCVVPKGAEAAIDEMLAAISTSGQGSLLAVLKTFGAPEAHTPPGLLSFPLAGATLALDFPDRDEETEALFARLDAIVAAAGGRLYPAKDARMPRSLFRAGYAKVEEFARFVDPKFSSNFWRRVID
ncbi:FAD-binding oxidoreductase [Rhodocyclus purpureus]|uniref:FAD-binding oxidoreductase n=1 Tax=Rhodocyclus purpureus TaxID=1067 RepID=UPI0019138844|nr:FAD-binding oxidoreductase [Rhodocyclus purpureus]MBK5914446.1 FAD-binding oxidoreductase [Rhodocyclus purpureus]